MPELESAERRLYDGVARACGERQCSRENSQRRKGTLEKQYMRKTYQ